MEQPIDYRKKFKEFYNIDFSNEYEIHHIDLNHANNEINNLMLLPKKLHHKYHFLLGCVERNPNNTFEVHLDAKIHSTCLNGDQYNLIMVPQLIKVLQECNEWYDYKMYLEGLIPNIHNIIL